VLTIWKEFWGVLGETSRLSGGGRN